MKDRSLIKQLAFLTKSRVLVLLDTKKSKEYYYNLDNTPDGLYYFGLSEGVQNILSLYTWSEKPLEILYKNNKYTIKDISDLKNFLDNPVFKKAIPVIHSTSKAPMDKRFEKLTNQINHYQTASIRDIQREFKINGILDPTTEEAREYRLREIKRLKKELKNKKYSFELAKKKRELILSKHKVDNFFSVEYILENLDVTSLLSYYNIKYREIGNNEVMCSSPFREDKNPSFCLNKENKLWIDFATRESGNIIKLVSLIEGLDIKKDFKSIIKIIENIK